MKTKKKHPQAKTFKDSIKKDQVLIGLVPLLGVFLFWITPLAFAPVPWPDDSAFYLVAKSLFQWPPSYTMQSQAAFEETYRFINFNTMPGYPLIVGIGRLFGIKGSFLIKLWPLLGWALSISLILLVLYRAKLPRPYLMLVGLLFLFDPELKWASMLLRPESLIGLCGMILVLGLTFGFPKKLQARSFWWDPISATLAMGAYLHFNAIHLVIPVFLFYLFQPLKLVRIGLITLAYLSPWILLIFLHFDTFITQMALQWERLSHGNGWLSSWEQFSRTFFTEMGNPDPYLPILYSIVPLILFLLVLAAFFFGISVWKKDKKTITLILPSFTWFLSAVLLWHFKPEVWFKYFMHLSAWTWISITFLALFRNPAKLAQRILDGSSLLGLGIGFVFLMNLVFQAQVLGESESWRWKSYSKFVHCIEQALEKEQTLLGKESADFQVFFPTFPDVIVELSEKHPEWKFTRTNDFSSRWDLGVTHAQRVDALVITDIPPIEEKTWEGPIKDQKDLQSRWLQFKGYYLERLNKIKDFKPKRYACQVGRWQAFLFFEEHNP